MRIRSRGAQVAAAGQQSQPSAYPGAPIGSGPPGSRRSAPPQLAAPLARGARCSGRARFHHPPQVVDVKAGSLDRQSRRSVRLAEEPYQQMLGFHSGSFASDRLLLRRRQGGPGSSAGTPLADLLELIHYVGRLSNP